MAVSFGSVKTARTMNPARQTQTGATAKDKVQGLLVRRLLRWAGRPSRYSEGFEG